MFDKSNNPVMIPVPKTVEQVPKEEPKKKPPVRRGSGGSAGAFTLTPTKSSLAKPGLDLMSSSKKLDLGPP